MKIIEIQALGNGAHRNQTVVGKITPPEGWAVIPEEMECENFPFGDVAAQEVDGVMTVTLWTPGEIPESVPAQAVPTAQDDTDAMLVDHEYRLTLLELGLTE